MNLLFFYSYFIFGFLSLSISKLVPIKIYPMLGAYQATIYIGNPKQLVLCDIDLEKDYTLVTNFFFKNNSDTVIFYNNETISIKDNPQKVQKLSDTFHLIKGSIETNVSGLYFYHLTDSSSLFIIDNTISFSFKYRNKEFSLIHNLYTNKQIDHLSFYLSSTEMYIGGIPENDIFKSIYNVSLPVNNNNKYSNYTTWGITLNGIFFDNNTSIKYINNGYAFLRVRSQSIYAPSSFMKFMNQSVFDKMIQSGYCSYSKEGMKEYTYKCNCKILEDFPVFNFVIDGYIFQMSKYDLFEYETMVCYFKIKENINNEWILGTAFTSRYTLFFDYEKESITFFNENPFLPFNQNASTLRTIFIILSSFLSISSIYLLLCLFISN